MAKPEPIKARIPSVMEDPSRKAVARVYSEALVNAAGNADGEQVLEEFASFMEDVLDRQPEFASLLMSGLVNRDETLRLIDRVVTPHASPLFANFLRTLARHGRLDLLPVILNESRLLMEVRLGRRRVQVTSAKALSKDSLDRIRERVAAAVSFSPILEAHTDVSLLGGLVIRIGDTVYDGSLKNRIKQLRSRLRQRSVHEIQSGRDRFGNPA